MCGIIGVTADPEVYGNVVPRLVEGLKLLEYRGYDSAGFALVECGTGRLVVLKDKGRIDDIVEKYRVTGYCAATGIAHTRWATHGAPSRVNAHPHMDCSGRIAVVHNGIIKNFAELRAMLEERGHRFQSETDTEVIAHLFEEYLRQGLEPLDAFRRLVSVVEGAYAIALIHLGEPSRIYFARNVSPLIIGLGNGFNAVSSDIPSLLPLTRRVLALRDGEYGFIEPYKVYIEYRGRPVAWSERVTHVAWSVEAASKGGYPHYMLKEIMEQPRVLYETYMGLLSSDEVQRAASLIASAGRVFITGAGTSYHAGLVFAYYMATVAGTPVYAFIASEHETYANLFDSDTVLIAVSQSGETIDTLQALRAARKRGSKIIAVSNVVASTIPRESDVAIYTRAGPEIGVAATKTFLTQVLALTLLSLEVARLRGAVSESMYSESVKRLADSGRKAGEGLERSSRQVERLVGLLKEVKSMYILGRGLGVPLALEAALKVKEVSYIHAEAYPAGESKHGPIALVEEGFPVIFIGADDGDMRDRLQSNVMEMKARGAYTVVVGSNAYSGMKGVDMYIGLGAFDELTAPYAVIPPLQLLAYKLAVALGRDPDKPRNLAKTVTVE
ncbi:MAG: glutamine--fructose-6-phosphate transaminase (isomerizing) [Crenarchaeota archaeon]|nr:glutamine--fructose-6-phosphate transaminase (isomerizing) [Thermoproteota archaeon]